MNQSPSLLDKAREARARAEEEAQARRVEAETADWRENAPEASELRLDPTSMSVFFVARKHGQIILPKPIVLRISWQDFAKIIASFIQNTIGNMAGVRMMPPPPPL